MAIHLLCIWNLFWSGLVLLHGLGSLAPAPAALADLPLLGGVPLTLATIITALYVVCYLIMDPIAGGLGALLALALNQWSWRLVAAGAPVAGLSLTQATLAFHLAAWILQVITTLLCVLYFIVSSLGTVCSKAEPLPCWTLGTR